MKVKYILVLFLIGFLFVLVGALFRIQHYPYALVLLFVGTSLKIIAILLSLWKVFTSKKLKGFLDS
jgi:hypothetical protein